MEENENKVTGNDATASKEPNGTTFDVLPIGLGQAGGNLAMALKKQLNCNNAIAINTSSSDLRSLVDISNQYKYKIGNIEGAGQNRDLSKVIAKSKTMFDNFINAYSGIIFKPNRIILVPFALGGGTGSGLAPYFIAKLSQYCATNEGKIIRQEGEELVEVKLDIVTRPIVIGIGILPSLKSNNEGVKTLQNTIECLNELNKLVENKAISLMLVSNDNSDYSFDTETRELFNDVNDRIAKICYRILKVNGISMLKNIDLNDKLNSLNLPGLISVVYGKLIANKRIDNESPFGLFENSTFKRLLAELPEEYSKDSLEAATSFLTDKNISYSDSRIGYTQGGEGYSLDTEELKKIILILSGMDSLKIVSEPYASKLETLLERQEKLTANLKENSTGFETMAKTRSKLDKDNKVVASDDLLNDL